MGARGLSFNLCRPRICVCGNTAPRKKKKSKKTTAAGPTGDYVDRSAWGAEPPHMEGVCAKKGACNSLTTDDLHVKVSASKP